MVGHGATMLAADHRPAVVVPIGCRATQ
jgi:hypothetical protein